MQLAAAQGALGPAVINHVAGGAGAVQGGEVPPAGRTTTQKTDEAADAEELRRLKARDSEVRAHEQAHAAAGGALAGAPSYKFERGPDGHSYAVSGEVSIDVSVVSGDAGATIEKMQRVKRAALAPANPSDADRAIAARADAKIVAARLEQTTGQPQRPENPSVPPVAGSPMAGDAAQAAFGAHARRNGGAATYKAAAVADPGNVVDVVS